MKIFKIPQNLKAIIFDIDGTLYTCPAYVFEQVDVQIRYWSKLNGWTSDEGRKKMNDFRKKWSEEHNGKKISLGNAFTHFGVSIEQSIEWRNSLLHPENFLEKNKELSIALEYLKSKYKLLALTNNPVSAAKKNLAAIGISNQITDIIGLDTCYKSKPAKEMLEKASRMENCTYNQMLSVGDRYDIDLALPLEMGTGGVLVNGAEDVISLSKML